MTPKILNENNLGEMVHVSRLKQHEQNVNQGDFGAIQESIEAHGFFGALVVQKRTGKILAGNHRFAVAKQLGYSYLPVFWVDVDDDTAIRILLADNRTSRLGHDDASALAELLSTLAVTEKELAGTCFDTDYLDRLVADLAQPLDLSSASDGAGASGENAGKHTCPSCGHNF